MKHKLKRIFIGFGIIIGVVLIIGIGFLVKYAPQLKAFVNDADQKVASINSGTFRSREETVIYDKDGKVLKKLAIHDYSYVNSKDIPLNAKNAVIAIEDKRFYEHGAIDYQAYLRVLGQIITSKGKDIQGGSSITQQLVKNVFLSDERTIPRKIEEMLIALKIEKLFSKDQILEFYLNNIYYGNGAYGLGTASHTYFNKPLKDLTLPEIALLTGIPNNPTLYNPVKNPKNADDRKNLILSNMKQLNLITEQQYKEAVTTKVRLNMPQKQNEPDSYEVSYAINEATKVLMQQSGFQFKYVFSSDAERERYLSDYEDTYGQMDRKIRNGGYSIYTSIDMQKQKKLQDSLNDNLSSFTDKDPKTGLYETQGAGVCLENKTGQVVAIVGGRTQNDVANPFNRAYLAFRQPGSTIKPLIAYTPAFDLGNMPFTMMQDKYIPNGPKNEEKAFYGNVTLRYATELSLNTIPYQLLMKYGSRNMLTYLDKMKFSHITPSDNTPVLALGGFTIGVSPVEMAGGYSTLARNGEFINPTCLTKIKDITQNVIYQNTYQETQIYKPQSAFMMTDVLEGVINKPYATGYGKKILDIPTAGKTGTTDDHKDGWFAGYTPLYTTVVWVGDDNPQYINDLFGSSYPGHIWYDFMTQIHKDVTCSDFTMPNTVHRMKVNPYTGMAYPEDSYHWGNDEVVTDQYLQDHNEGDLISPTTQSNSNNNSSASSTQVLAPNSFISEKEQVDNSESINTNQQNNSNGNTVQTPNKNQTSDNNSGNANGFPTNNPHEID